MTVRTMFIGLDGATFTLLDRLMDTGVMPFLKGFIAAGVRADLRSIIPPLTPPAWTSLLTGRSPGQHGIFDFFQLDAPGSTQIRLATATDLRCPTIADVANRSGQRTTLLNFPVTFPPPAINGHVVAGWMPWRQLRLGCHPPALYDQLKTLPGFNPRELAMDMALEVRATEGCRDDEFGDWIALHMRRDQRWLELVRQLISTDPSEFTAVLFDGPDKIQHLCWRFLDPAYIPSDPHAEDRSISALCLAYYRQLDDMLAEIVSLVGHEATVVIASDHGFGATTEVFHINSWLEQHGYLAWSAQIQDADTAPTGLGMDSLSRHTQWIDWTHTTAYVSTPTSNGIHIVVADAPGKPGIAPADYESFRRELIDALLRYTDPATDAPVVTQVWTREEVFNGPAMGLAPDLTLALRDGGLVSVLPALPPLQPRPAPSGTHRPIGVFIANGPGLRRGMQLGELSILDVAPTLIYSLGLAIPEDLEGRVPLEAFEASLRAKCPVQFAPVLSASQQSFALLGHDDDFDEESELIILERLRSLGYVE